MTLTKINHRNNMRNTWRTIPIITTNLYIYIYIYKTEASEALTIFHISIIYKSLSFFLNKIIFFSPNLTMSETLSFWQIQLKLKHIIIIYFKHTHLFLFTQTLLSSTFSILKKEKKEISTFKVLDKIPFSLFSWLEKFDPKQMLHSG